MNSSYVLLSLHVPHYASMKETQAERKKGMMSIGQTVMLKTSAVKLITHYFAGLRRQTGLSYIPPLSVVKFTFNRLLDTAHPRRCIEVLRMPLATFLALKNSSMSGQLALHTLCSAIHFRLLITSCDYHVTKILGRQDTTTAKKCKSIEHFFWCSLCQK